MRLNELKLLTEMKVTSKFGVLEYRWKADLEDEEGDDYLPDGYSKKVLELSLLEVNEPGNGHGDELMKKFMQTRAFSEAELVFLDPAPYIGANFNSSLSDEEQIAKIKKFYTRYGFRSNGSAARMWLIRKGSIPDSELPT
jgi:hypothetical protein